MSKKPVPAKHTKGATAAAVPGLSPQNTMSNSEISLLIEAKISEALSNHETQLQLEMTKQLVQDMSTRLQQLSEGFHGVNENQSKRIENQSKRIENIEAVLGSLQQNHSQLERHLKQEIDRAVVEKVRGIQQKIRLEPGAERLVNEERCSEQLAHRDAAHQQELQKLHQHHHQDMLSVINDCCQKLKSGFNRQHKPYDVSEIHAVIDDIEQKMVCEILSEIQKTNTHEDLSSLEEALESVKQSRDLCQAKDDVVKATTLTTEDISSALETFENETFDNWSEELKPTNNEGGGYLFEGPEEPAVEEVISKSQGMITGDRGNLYYTEELRKTVDDMMSVTGNTETKKDSEDLTPGPPQRTKNLEEIEESLESLMISDSPSSVSHPKAKVDNLADPKSHEVPQIAPEASGPDSFSTDLMSIDALIAADFGTGFSSDGFPGDLLPPPSSSKDDEHYKSIEAKIAGDQERLQSFEGTLESEITKEASGKAKGEAVAKQSSPTKEQVQSSQSQSVSAKHEEKQPIKKTTAPAAEKDSVKKP